MLKERIHKLNIIEKLLNIIFPIQCGICGKLGNNICDECYNNLKKYEIRKQYEDVFFAYKYEGIIRNLIIKYKFNDKAYLYKTFSEILLKNKNLCKFLESYDIIIPVPLHKKRLKERGYNQADLITKEIAKNSGLMYYRDVLIKNKNIKPQSVKNVQDRINDVLGIYEVKNIYLLDNKNVLIFDDIYTTGSTTKECKKVLLDAGANKVGILALSKDYIN